MPRYEIWINGRAVATAEAKVSVLDRGFLYGDSVFETLRTYNKKLFAVDDHLERLEQSAQRVFITFPLAQTELKSHLLRIVEESEFSECYVRVMITRGHGALGLDPRAALEPQLVVIVTQLQAPSREDYEEGICAVTYQAARLSDHTAAKGAKLGNYLVAVLGQKKAAEAGAKEALLVTDEGEVLEGATSNIFWTKGNLLCTVPIEAGILAGITRAHLIDLAPSCGFRVELYVPQLTELIQADAVFISSSIREILSLVRIDHFMIGDGRVNPKVRELHADFRQRALSS